MAVSFLEHTHTMPNITVEDRAATILIVDDNAALLRSVERLLRLEGFRTLMAADGLEALEIMSEAGELPGLIVGDISMPRMGGFALFEEVRSREAWVDIPFLFLTARDQLDDLRRGYSPRAGGYLGKPAGPERRGVGVPGKPQTPAEMVGRPAGPQPPL